MNSISSKSPLEMSVQRHQKGKIGFLVTKLILQKDMILELGQNSLFFYFELEFEESICFAARDSIPTMSGCRIYQINPIDMHLCTILSTRSVILGHITQQLTEILNLLLSLCQFKF
jgi:hypothetical protein